MEATGTVDILGVHPVPEVDGCYLIEAIVRGLDDVATVGAITQPSIGPEGDWQVAYDDKLLDGEGRSIAFDLFLGERPDEWPAPARIAFYLHELDLDAVLRTPWGEAALPSPTPLPDRLGFLRYEEP